MRRLVSSSHVASLRLRRKWLVKVDVSLPLGSAADADAPTGQDFHIFEEILSVESAESEKKRAGEQAFGRGSIERLGFGIDRVRGVKDNLYRPKVGPRRVHGRTDGPLTGVEVENLGAAQRATAIGSSDDDEAIVERRNVASSTRSVHRRQKRPPVSLWIIHFNGGQAVPGVGSSCHVDMIVMRANASLVSVLVHRRHLMPLAFLWIKGHAVLGGSDGVRAPTDDDQQALQHANAGAAAWLR